MTSKPTALHLELHVANVLPQCIMSERAGQVYTTVQASVGNRSQVESSFSIIDARLAQLNESRPAALPV